MKNINQGLLSDEKDKRSTIGTENRKFAVWLSFGPWDLTVSLWWSFFSMWCHIEKKLQQGSASDRDTERSKQEEDENQEWRQRTVWLRVVPCLNLIWTVFFYVTDICLFTLGWLRYRYREVKARRRWVLGELCDWGSFPGMELSPSDGEAFTILDPALLSFNSSPTRYRISVTSWQTDKLIGELVTILDEA